MPDRRAHRGPHPEDARLFDAAAVEKLRAAAGNFCWLLDRGYAHDSALKLVGDRHGLVARQRTAVSRCCCTAAEAASRRRREVGIEKLAGAALWIDGYNVLTTVEAALAGGVILAARDGAYRDMASMHGSYRKVAETIPALELLGRTLEDARLGECRWLFDRPVSNSGRLKGIADELAAARGWPWRVELVADPDALLSELATDGVFAEPVGVAVKLPPQQTAPQQFIYAATADSAILDRCPGWFNLARETLCRHVGQARVLSLADACG
ncbi:MAG: DUF434 domain-containing protein [Pirellulales bacterium]|nr:DUF434 domain-containing protein [Pirellulales bacterium]